MTVNELIALLETYRDDFDGGEWEVRMVYQPNYPLESLVAGVTSGVEINAEIDSEDDPDFDSDGDVEADEVVYITEGRQVGYGSRRAWGDR